MNDLAERALWDDGYAVVGDALAPADAAMLVERYGDSAAYRSTIVMARHNYGSGEYRYFRYPLPEVVQNLRDRWYSALAPIANAWNEATRVKERYPARLEEYIDTCHAAGQARPTPLILRYEAGDFNCMHQDVYGELGFPFQITIPLSEPGIDFEGAETVLLQQAPRMQARPIIVRPSLGQALIFPNRYQPRKGASGAWVRYGVRHGVAPLTRGCRFALGLIFHDAQ
ncbi:MAG: 2OG-Fe(II) oxygenase [Vulcanimicrobiaceae bacterium]